MIGPRTFQHTYDNLSVHAVVADVDGDGLTIRELGQTPTSGFTIYGADKNGNQDSVGYDHYPGEAFSIAFPGNPNFGVGKTLFYVKPDSGTITFQFNYF